MPDGLIEVISLLTVGYILLLLELFVPGGILGILGGAAIIYGCLLAFQLGTLWGVASMGLSVVVTVGVVTAFLRSRTAKKLILSSEGPKTWKGQDISLVALLGREGTALSGLRPAGIAEIDDERIDVVADGEFLAAGTAVRVVEVEGNRVVVEAVEALEEGPETTDGDAEDVLE